MIDYFRAEEKDRRGVEEAPWVFQAAEWAFQKWTEADALRMRSYWRFTVWNQRRVSAADPQEMGPAVGDLVRIAPQVLMVRVSEYRIGEEALRQARSDVELLEEVKKKLTNPRNLKSGLQVRDASGCCGELLTVEFREPRRIRFPDLQGRPVGVFPDPAVDLKKLKGPEVQALEWFLGERETDLGVLDDWI